MAYLKDFEKLVPFIKQANGTPVIITAEEEKYLPDTLATTGFSGESIVDPENQLAQRLESLGKLNVAISEKSGYPHGLAQPAVLVMKKDGTVLNSWNIVPSAVCYTRQVTDC